MTSVAEPAQFPPDEGLEIAFAGRSNSGKSTAINALLNRRGLARVSRTPGRTQLLNYFELAPHFRFVDLPGYGYAAVPPPARDRWIGLLDQLPHRRSFRGLVLLIDSRRGVQQQDLDVIAWSGLPADAIHVLLSKCDQLARQAAREALQEAQSTLEGCASVRLFSATKGEGVEAARKVLEHWAAEATRQ